MITKLTGDNALKDFYLPVFNNQLNTTTNPFYNQIKKSGKAIQAGGRQIVANAPYGLNGGVGFGTDSGTLPSAGGLQDALFKQDVKDVYGVIEITDKAMKASRGGGAKAFADLLEREMESILNTAKFCYARALFTDGTGVLATVTTNAGSGVDTIVVSDVKYLVEGMAIDIYAANHTKKVSATRITSINRGTKTIIIDGTVDPLNTDYICMQGSKGNEIDGLAKIFGTGALYGVTRTTSAWMVPYIGTGTGSISDSKIQTAIDEIEVRAGGNVDYISCAFDVRKAYLSYKELTKRNVDMMEIAGGFKAMSYNGIPMYADKHQNDGTMDLLQTKDFMFHEMGDFEFMDEGQGILKQIASKPAWTATLTKYGNLMCMKPSAQARLTGITE